MTQMLTLTGYILVPDDDLSAVIAALPEHIALSQAEAGCVHFSVTQHPDNPNRFDVKETFINTDAFHKHQKRLQNSHWASVSHRATRHYQTYPSLQ